MIHPVVHNFNGCVDLCITRLLMVIVMGDVDSR